MSLQAAAPPAAARAARGAMLGAGVALSIVAVLALARVLTAPELPVIAAVPPFKLIDQQERTVTLAMLAGRPWVASFVYTSCPGPCPVVVEKLKALRRDVPASDLAIVSLSVDPQSDTPAVLARYAQRHGIDASQHWLLLTGEPDEVLTLIRKGFLSSVGTAAELLGPEAEAGEIEAVLEREGAVVHSIRLILVDAQGQIRGVYSSDDPEQLARLRTDARSLTR